MPYDPPRRKTPGSTSDPLEVALVFGVRPCGTCSFFWPPETGQQPYGPYPAYDFDANTPAPHPAGSDATFAWLNGTTRPGCFPDAEIMDGCRKAPIMTIGINPNLTAFLPGAMGANWCYPSFSSDNGTDSWTKYAYYYRYRSVYQERFDPNFVQQFLNPDKRILAAKPGTLVSADRPSDAPEYPLKVRYDGEDQDTAIVVPNKLGEPRYVLLFDVRAPHNRFQKGDTIAAQLDVPAGRNTTIFAQGIGYYQRILPVLGRFETFLRSRGHHDARLKVGEDVCQLDMVACASPHWGPPWLGGTSAKVQEVIGNCVTKNAWALKQLLQTRPAVLFLVGEATFNMFRFAFGRLIHADAELPAAPTDGAFTLLRLTTDRAYRFEFAGTIDGRAYEISVRLVVTPHFSYGTNFLPQYRLSAEAWAELQHKFPDCAQFLQHDPRLQFVPPGTAAFAAFQIVKDDSAVLSHVEGTWPKASAILDPAYYDPNQIMEGVLQDAYASGELSYTVPKRGQAGFLARTAGPCVFCVNDHWKFPLGCPYGKPDEAPLPAGFLDKVSAAVVAAGAKTHPEVIVRRMIDDGFEASRGAESHG
jgi:hypothetical protein